MRNVTPTIPCTLFCGGANRGSLNEGLWLGGRIWPIDSIGRPSEAAGSEGGRAVWDRESVAAVAWLWRDTTVALLRRRQQARSVLPLLMARCCKYLLPTDCSRGYKLNKIYDEAHRACRRMWAMDDSRSSWVHRTILCVLALERTLGEDVECLHCTFSTTMDNKEPTYQIQKNFPNKFSSQPAMNIWNSISTLFAAVDICYSLTGEGLFRNLPILSPGMMIVHYVSSN